jgi:ferric-dicitrate binding protein FerR (iron transport regulator)
MVPGNIHTIDDLLSNDSFKRWLLDNDAADAGTWNQWLLEHPEKLELVATAKALILSIHHIPGLTAAEIEQEISIFRNSMELADHTESLYGEQGTEEPRQRRMPFAMGWLKVAAIVLLIAGSWFAYKRIAPASPGRTDTYQQFLADNVTHNIEYANNTDSVQQFVLADGTAVLLEPGSRMSFSRKYAAEKREVFLTGNAFFNVAKKSSSPFIVYSKNIITKVLGTSFWIKHNGNNNQTSVIVKTGRVSVCKPAVNGTGNNPELSGVILTPNQQIVYDAGIDQMKKTLVAAPEISEPVSKNDFSFNDTPADRVFKKLEEVYGISILFDREVLSTCTVSASLGDESFYDKLRMICRVIHADYQTVDGNIIINSKGCK